MDEPNIPLKKLLLGIWILFTLGLDLWIGLHLYAMASWLHSWSDGPHARCILEYNNLPSGETVVNQIIISLVLALFGTFWSSIIWLATRAFMDIIGCRFGKLSINLSGMSLSIAIIAICLGSLKLYYDQVMNCGH